MFKDKVAIVTGGASGIGRELCMELAKEGATVYVSDINGTGADQTVSMITKSGGKAETILADVRNPEAVENLVNQVVARGQIDYMFNNAGVIMFGEFQDMAYDDWHHFIDSDIMSVIYGTKCAYEVMIRQGYGHIVNVASVFGIFPFALATGYTAVKQAVVGLSLALRTEAVDLGVKVSVACPGTVNSEVRKTYTIFKGDRDTFNSYIIKQLTPNQTALKILKGVKKNKGLIAFPFYDLIPWWLYRLHPSLNNWWQRKMVKLFRDKIKIK